MPTEIATTETLRRRREVALAFLTRVIQQVHQAGFSQIVVDKLLDAKVAALSEVE